MGDADEFLLRQRLRLGCPAFEQQAAKLGQGFERLRIDAITLLAVPDRVFVQLDPLFGDAAKDHRSQSAIPDGQRVFPFLCGVRVPEHGIARAGDGGAGGNHGEREQEQGADESRAHASNPDEGERPG